jgi:hypothetical protein
MARTNRSPSLDIYIQYEYLASNDLSRLLNDLNHLLIEAYRAYPNSSRSYEPFLEVGTIRTGNSVRLKLVEGWQPNLSTDSKGEIEVSIPKKLGLPVLLAVLLVHGASDAVSARKDYYEGEKARIETALERQEANKVMQSDRAKSLEEEARKIAGFIATNPAFTAVSVNKVGIKGGPDGAFRPIHSAPQKQLEPVGHDLPVPITEDLGEKKMSTQEDVKAAEQRMNNAKAALQRYTERPDGAATDIKLHRQLAEALKKATDEYVAIVADLRP